MSIKLGNDSIKLALGDAIIKKRYLGDVRVYASELALVKNSALESGVELTNIISRSGTSTVTGTDVRVRAYSGAQFALNVSKFSPDIRGTDKVTGHITRPSSIGQPGYNLAAIVIGTAAEINAITYTAYGNLYTGNCDRVWYGSDINGVDIDFDISLHRKTSEEPIYVAVCVGAYNSATNFVTVNELSCN